MQDGVRRELQSTGRSFKIHSSKPSHTIFHSLVSTSRLLDGVNAKDLGQMSPEKYFESAASRPSALLITESDYKLHPKVAANVTAHLLYLFYEPCFPSSDHHRPILNE